MKSAAPARTAFSLWAPVFLYAALIFFLSSYSFHFPWFRSAQKNHADWLAHVVEYSFFGLLLCRALSAQSFLARPAGRLWIAVVVIGALYGATDEFHQRFVPERDSSAYDMMADTAGTALGALAWLKMIRKENA